MSENPPEIKLVYDGCSDGVAMPRFTPKSLDEFTDAPGLSWIVKKIIPRAELVMIFGESGCGKSFLTLNLAMAIARGIEWHGHKISKQGRVVYICAESPAGFRGRTKAYRMRHDLEAVGSIPNFTVIDEAPNFMSDADPKAIAQRCGPCDVIVIDTMARVTAGGDENSGEAMGAFLSRCQALHRAMGALIIMVHHSGKNKESGSRGWSGIRAAADTEIFVEKTGNSHKATVTKQKDGPDNISWGFDLLPYVIGTDEDGDDIDTCVYEMASLPTTRIAPRKLGRWQETVMLVFEDAVKHESNSFILEMVLIDFCLQKVPTDDKELKNDNRDQIRRALHALYNKKLLVKDGEKVFKPIA